MNDGYNVAVVGATGAVGTKLIEMLEQTNLPLKNVKLLASKRSAGRKLLFKGEGLFVEELVPEAFDDVDIAIFSAGGSISQKFAPEAVKRGTVVVDNTSQYRMDKDTPLVVPEVNKQALKDHQGIIANPNCSTIQMMVTLAPIKQSVGIDRVIVSTYQAVSGAGAQAVEEVKQQNQKTLDGELPENLSAEILPAASDKKHYPLAFNALAQIDEFAENDYTKEEWKMVNETKKILEDKQMKISATCVRVPVITGHSESIYIETEDKISLTDLRATLENAPGVTVEDDPSQQIYPQAINSVGKKDTFVGRIRQDLDVDNGFHLWVVSDNLLKGAAWNSVQIAETLHEMNLVHV
ncbi:aspartate-semialdehyde dehydrogenase [Tetragenococcus halophilus]|uniref:Aspartate-semialdehyde dehydrogenase n=1 Tax=Tetragenococcus halophilus (strain DSM 20338 / JCM 20259 / NCIMB 9735 / NBRC 12172) TaxID=945021 RepID=A0AAN1SEP6_TETHN|nr:aspartate-semialdehyde dehydrogenase [Tetragenococcus halophilus]BAK93638.1 aspartate-semialdehyde dehydrogenase [Tetragenococcus halophilus NBRC 12172]GBD69873.1 aspartate-semialdehyde dehydrogenase [Tetragenococcus halophilus subsp. halophilus]GFK28175.1 aspartate-semialdehyde dehydrogenase [Tetragenococcus halophilus]GLL50642.1 aspartate-semialdehyde dehydrogenase [Tetragenococcus halophilus]